MKTNPNAPVNVKEQGIIAYEEINSAVLPQLNSLTDAQYNALGGRYHPAVALQLILEIEGCRRSILAACAALHRALERNAERAAQANAIADGTL